MFDYVKDHNFGYGCEEEKEIIKLELRNLQDVETYVSWTIKDLLNGKLNGNILQHVSGTKEQFFLERV